MPNKQLLLRYAEIKIQIAKYESELEMLKEQALKEVKDIQGDTNQPVALSELPGFSFSVQKRKTLTYSPTTQQAEKALEKRKKEEQATGDATFVEKESLVFNSPKE